MTRDRDAVRLSTRRDQAVADLKATEPQTDRQLRLRDEAVDDLRRLTNKTIDGIVQRSKKAAVSDGFPSSTIGEGTSRSSISNPTATAAERHAGGKDARDYHGEKVINRNGDPIGLPDTWVEQPDPVRDTIRELDALLHNIARTARRRDPEWLAEIARWCRSVDRKRQYVTSSPKLTGRPSSGQCKGCGRAVTGTDDDKLRAGFCSACSGSCRACDRVVAGTDEDRLRSGYCHSCYEAWRYRGYPDRYEFEQERRAYMATKEARTA